MGVTRGEIGAQSPGRRITMGAPTECADAEKSQQCQMYFLQYSAFASEDLNFEHGGAKLASSPWRHLTSLRL